MNAGSLPDDHWLNDPADGGGRLLGEGCHFVDFACWFAGALPTRVSATMRAAAGQPLAAGQSFNVALDFADGSLATIFYSAEGGRATAQGVRGGALGRASRPRSTTSAGPSRRRAVGSGGAPAVAGQDKGHAAQFRHLHDVVVRGAAPMGPDPLDSMAVTLAALRSAETGAVVTLI